MLISASRNLTFIKFYTGAPNSCSVVSHLTTLNDHITEYVCSSSASTDIQDRSNTCFLPVGDYLNASLSHTRNHHTPASQEALSPSLCLSSCLSVCLSPTDSWQSLSFLFWFVYCWCRSAFTQLFTECSGCTRCDVVLHNSDIHPGEVVQSKDYTNFKVVVPNARCSI